MAHPQTTSRSWTVTDADWSERGYARYELQGVRELCVADARLIEAAPDLLEALKLVMNWRSIDHLAASEVAAMEALIARVERA